MLHVFMLNICFPPHSLPYDKIFLWPITGFKAPCGSGAAKPNCSRRENKNLDNTTLTLNSAFYLKLGQWGAHKPVNDGYIAAQKVGIYPIPGRSATLLFPSEDNISEPRRAGANICQQWPPTSSKLGPMLTLLLSFKGVVKWPIFKNNIFICRSSRSSQHPIWKHVPVDIMT